VLEGEGGLSIKNGKNWSCNESRLKVGEGRGGLLGQFDGKRTGTSESQFWKKVERGDTRFI